MFGVRKAAREFADCLREVQRETERLKKENAKLRDAMFSNAKKHALHHMDEDELRIWATQQEECIEELKELVRDMFEEIEYSGFDPLVERQGKRGSYYEEDPSWRVGIRERIRELGIEVEDDD